MLGIYLSTLEGRLLQASPEFVRLLGYERFEELAEIPLETLYADPQERAHLVAQLRMQGRIEARPVVLRLRDGSTRTFWVSALFDPERGLIAGSLFDSSPFARRYEALVRSIRGIVWELELPEWRWTYVSPYVEEVLGYRPEAFLEDPNFWASHIHPEDREEAVRFCRRMTEAGQDHEFTYRMITSDGRIVWIQDRVTVVWDQDRIVGLRGIMTDITPLQESEMRFRALVENSPEAIAVHQDGQLVYVNPESLRVMGARSSEELLGRPVLDFVHPDYRDQVIGRIRQMLTTGVPAPPAEEMLLRTDGSAFEAEIRAVPILWGGRPAAQVIVRDISERKRLERALAERQALLERILEQAPDPISIGILEPRPHLVYVNPAFEALTGYSAKELCRPHFDIQQIVDPRYHPIVEERFRRMQLGLPVPSRYELRLRSREGRYHDVEVSVRPITWAGQKATLNILRDITERKALEEAWERARREAEEASRMKTHFLAAMSHEIRTPLTAILGFAEILHESLDSQEQKELLEFVEKIQAGGHWLMRLLSNLIDLAALEANRLPIEPHPLRLDILLKALIEFFLPEATARGLALEGDFPPEPVVVIADELRLRQALENFLRNAIKYTDQGTIRLGLEVLPEANRARVTISDTGRGMSPEFLRQSLFEPFRQESEGIARAYEGGGLEMAIARRLLDRMGGAVEVQSAPGAGTTVTIELPLPTPPSSQSGPTPIEKLRALAPRLLIVEDIPENAELLRAYLRGVARVSVAPDAQTALHMATEAARHNDPFSAFLIDLHLPGGKSGIELLAELRQLHPYTHRPMIAQTAYADRKEDEAYLLQQGFDAVLSKPIRRPDLIEVLVQLLSGPASEGKART